MSYRILMLNTLMEAGGAQKAMLQLARGFEIEVTMSSWRPCTTRETSFRSSSKGMA